MRSNPRLFTLMRKTNLVKKHSHYRETCEFFVAREKKISYQAHQYKHMI